MDVNLIPSKRLVPGGDAVLPKICLPPPLALRGLCTRIMGTPSPGPHGWPEMKCSPRNCWGGCWVPAHHGLGLFPGAKWGDKSFWGDHGQAMIATHQLLAPFRVPVLSDPHREALWGVTAAEEGDSQHLFVFWEMWGAQKPPGNSGTCHPFPPTIFHQVTEAVGWWAGFRGCWECGGTQVALPCHLVATLMPGGLGSCNRGEDKPCHHVPIPASLQSGELPPWVPLCLHSPSQDHGPGRGWELWAKACPAALD